MIDRLQARICYTARDPALLEAALIHSSYANEQPSSRESNERLEFLGDAVLQLVVADALYRLCDGYEEGDLTTFRAAVVCESSLADVARKLELGEFLKLGKGEEMTGGRQKNSVLASVFEAIVGAVFLDRGFEAAREFVLRHLGDRVKKALSGQIIVDYKAALNSAARLRRKGEVRFELESETGPDHDKRFVVVAKVGDYIYGRGVGKNKKEAEQKAAREALARL